MIFRAVAINSKENDRPYDAQGTKNVEDGPPSEVQQNGAGNQRRGSNGEAAEKMRSALNESSLRPGEPELHTPAGYRKSARSAQPKKKSSRKQGGHTEG